MEKNQFLKWFVPSLCILGALNVPAHAQKAIAANSTALVSLTSNPIADAVCATLKRDASTLFLWRSTFNKTDKYYGPITNPQQNRLWEKYNDALFSIPANLQSSMRVTGSSVLPIVTTIPSYRFVNFYLKNVYDLGSSMLLGFVHLEYLAWVKYKVNGVWDGKSFTPGYDPVLGGADHYTIGMVYSTDAGYTWKFLGDIIRPNDHTPNIGSGNIGGAAYLHVGSNIYVYFNEKGTNTGTYPSVAMASLSSITSAAAAGNVVSWKKYNAATHAFDQNGLSGLGSQIISGTGLDMHADAAYCTPLKQYLLTVNDGNDLSLWIYRSNDGINWNKYRPFAQKYTGTDGFVHYPCYPYFASTDADASSDNSTVGKNFSLIYIAQHTPDFNKGEQWQYTDEAVYRVPMFISDMFPVTQMLK
jgi:hypothetical protein